METRMYERMAISIRQCCITNKKKKERERGEKGNPENESIYRLIKHPSHPSRVLPCPNVIR